MAKQVVAHFLDGHVVKGVSLDVDPSRPTCHISTPDQGTLEVRLADLKALYFVRSFDGNPAFHRQFTVDPTDIRARGAQAVEVRFGDGERMVGFTMHFPPVRPFFFVIPASHEDNNIRVLVNRAAAVGIAQPNG